MVGDRQTSNNNFNKYPEHYTNTLTSGITKGIVESSPAAYVSLQTKAKKRIDSGIPACNSSLLLSPFGLDTIIVGILISLSLCVCSLYISLLHRCPNPLPCDRIPFMS
jgi:hypothetical protein